MNNNEYLKVYLQTINSNMQTKKTVKKHTAKILKKSLLIEEKRRVIKSKLYKNLISEAVNQQIQINCHIDLLTKVAGCQNGVSQDDLYYLPRNLFQGQFNTKELSGSEVEIIKAKVSGAINNAVENAKKDQSIAKLLNNKQTPHCLVCFLIVTEEKQGGVKQYFITTSHLNKFAAVFPHNRDWFQKINGDLNVFAAKHKQDKVLQVIDFTATMPLQILSVLWQAGKATCTFIADGVKDIFKNSVLAKWFANKIQSKKDFNEQTKKLIGVFTTIKSKHKQQFQKVDKDLQNKILFVIGDEKGKPVDGLINYKATIDKGEKITPQQFKALKALEEDFKQKLGNAQLFEQVKTDPSSVDQAANQPGADKSYAAHSKDPNFNKMCKTLGFKDKKKRKGLAALLDSILDSIMSLFGGGDDEKSEAKNSQAIKSAMPFVRDSIKAIPPGRYPVFFGQKPSQSEIEKKFQLLNK